MNDFENRLNKLVEGFVRESFNTNLVKYDYNLLTFENNQIFVDISDDEIKNRIKNWSKPDLKIKKGILYKYVKSVSNASSGCVTDE